MKEDLFNGDLFQDVEGHKYPGTFKKSKFFQQRFLPYVRIPVEYTVILSVLMLVLLVVSYAVGVERGKREAIDNLFLQESVDERPDNGISILSVPGQCDFYPDNAEELTEGLMESNKLNGNDYMENEVLTGETVRGEPEGSEAVIVDDEKVSKKALAEVIKEPYTIRLITFAKKQDAINEVRYLTGQKFRSGFFKNGKWFQVYVGGYTTLDEAKRIQDSLRKRYPDCYIRKEK